MNKRQQKKVNELNELIHFAFMKSGCTNFPEFNIGFITGYVAGIHKGQRIRGKKKSNVKSKAH